MKKLHDKCPVYKNLSISLTIHLLDIQLHNSEGHHVKPEFSLVLLGS